jgi:hypothetical protein
MECNSSFFQALIRIFSESPCRISGLLDCDNQLISQKDECGFSLLMRACENEEVDLVRLILSSKYCSKDALLHTSLSGHNALMIACKGSPMCAAELITSKFCSEELLNSMALDGDSALLLSLQYENDQLIELILSSPFCTIATVTQQNNRGLDVFIVACARANVRAIKLILRSKFFCKKLLTTKYNGITSFMFACSKGSIPNKCVMEILDHKCCDEGIISNSHDNNGSKILIYTARYRPDIAIAISKKITHLRGAQINGMECTYLHVLARFHPEYVREAIKFASANTLNARDEVGNLYYEYLPSRYIHQIFKTGYYQGGDDASGYYDHHKGIFNYKNKRSRIFCTIRLHNFGALTSDSINIKAVMVK